METIFIDSSAFLAMNDVTDLFFQRAQRTWQDLLEGDRTLVTNNYILLESIALIQRRVGLEAVEIIQTQIVPFLEIDWVNQELHDSLVRKMLKTNRRALSLFDHSAFDSMRRLGIQTVFTFDEHFREQGFSVIP